ncbi:hypothetical protein MHAS_03566 [Mycolicibacterium hassiacum DSM 44199]|jgi:hypothetical protein|uniref:hypothetical protein n=1 Tax=Mycolicibacterium hassiacum TaxID=46351 RepID=UPI0002F699EE|nr:hypothetical protein [Mycolicibacterium hassiacum]MBX5487400.1 hypothetical protein [Mycolicibacterium hassiacum]MDA4087529.1 hypothetical protein [Mycolicibacterium hassiacum DSM 44199]PZN18701.1 MAG: hypothetical protein DIU75_16405 [Mycolicibacterium hassiacum]VCT91847.1 hypothetical protein MHAS_03566 [Mycolicibacterium hassiacum DSM 44199]
METAASGYSSAVTDKKKPDTASTDVGAPGARDDVQSDPARHTEDRGVDWSDEGGATPAGPATNEE